MRMSFSRSDRNNLICLILAAFLAGCASKNPLMDDTPVAGTPVATSTNASSQSTEAAPAPVVQAKAPADISGIHVTPPTGLRRFLGIFTPYRVDVQQGNFISREMVDQLKEGMQRPEGVTREQVRFVLGTPLLTDIFHSDRWDYTFRLQKRSGEVISSNVTVFFDNNRLARIDGGNLPTEQEYLALIAGSAPGTAPAKK